MRETFKKKQKGDTISAGLINKLTRVARRVSSGQSSSYGHGKDGSVSPTVPFIQKVVRILSNAKEDGTHDAWPLYWHNTSGTWELDNTANQLVVDPKPFDIELAAGDIVTGWWHETRGAFIPIVASQPRSGAPTPATPDPPAPEPPCGCGCFEGRELPGDPTVCCTGHLIFKFAAWPFITDYELKHMGGDDWGTDPFVAPECDLGNGVSSYNTYRYRMRVSRTAAVPSYIVLEVVEDGGCPQVCIIYQMVKPFQCQCSNEFFLFDWDNVEQGDIGQCNICVHPVPEAPTVPPSETSCLTYRGMTEPTVLTVQIPGAFDLNVSGASGYTAPPHNCVDQATWDYYTEEYGNPSSGWVVLHLTGGQQPTQCYTTSYLQSHYADVNRRYNLPLGWTMLGPGVLPNTDFFPGAEFSEISVCATYGTAPLAQQGFIDHQVGWSCASIYGAPDPWKIATPLLLMKAYNYNDDPNLLAWRLVLRFEVPRFVSPIPSRSTPIGGTSLILYASEIFVIDRTTLDQSVVDAIFASPIELTKFYEGGCSAVDDTSALTFPSAVTATSLSRAFVRTSPTDSGSCAGCTPDAATPSDAGGCCYLGTFFRELTQEECEELGGTWYPDEEQGQEECEGTVACCLTTNCVETTADNCVLQGGTVAGGVGSTCAGGSSVCAAVESSSSSSSSVSSLSSSSVSSSSASSLSSSSSSSSQSASSVSSSVSSVSSQSDATGACCTNSSASFCTVVPCACVDGMTQAECDGSSPNTVLWLGAGTTCASNCPICDCRGLSECDCF